MILSLQQPAGHHGFSLALGQEGQLLAQGPAEAPGTSSYARTPSRAQGAAAVPGSRAPGNCRPQHRAAAQRQGRQEAAQALRPAGPPHLSPG